jgi:hypothetical protein
MAIMSGSMTAENAEILALEGLSWLASDPEGLQRFLDLSGLDLETLRQGAGSREMGLAVLDFLLGHEELLLHFCENAAVDPKDLHLARHRLGGV